MYCVIRRSLQNTTFHCNFLFFRHFSSASSSHDNTMKLITGFGSTTMSASPDTISVDISKLETAIKTVFGLPIAERKANILRQLEQLEAPGGQLEKLRSKKAYIAASGDRFSHNVMIGIFLSLVCQNLLLFNWVFFVFDWNMVEPITYFIAYSANTWFALMFYKFTGRDFSYECTLDELSKYRIRVLEDAGRRNGDFCSQKLIDLEFEVANLKNKIAQL